MSIFIHGPYFLSLFIHDPLVKNSVPNFTGDDL